jgi:Ca-activated chloride channel family protein
MRKFLLAALVVVCSGCAPGKLLIMEGNFHASRGRYVQAIAAYTRALSFPDAVPYGEFGLGTVYMALNEETTALSRFEEAGRALAERDSQSDRELLYRIVYNTGIIHFEAGDYENAAEEFRNALKYDSGRIEAKRNLELSLLSLSRNETASRDASRMSRLEGGANDNTLFEYMRQKEQERWKSRENREDEVPSGMDY